jgi:hypothetical protein
MDVAYGRHTWSLGSLLSKHDEYDLSGRPVSRGRIGKSSLQEFHEVWGKSVIRFRNLEGCCNSSQHADQRVRRSSCIQPMAVMIS